MQNPVASLQAHFGALTGPFPIANILQFWLMGILSVQYYDYIIHYKKDPKWLQCLVASVVVLNIFHSITTMFHLYHAWILNFGNYIFLLTVPWSQIAQGWEVAIITSIVQSYFAYRCYIVDRSLLVLFVLGILIVASAVGNFGAAIYATMILNESWKLPLLLPWLQASNWLPAACDVGISVVFALQLRAAQRGFNEATDNVLNRLLRMALETASVTSILAVMQALSFAINSTTSSFYAIPALTLPKAYGCCLLFILNSRSELRFAAQKQRSGAPFSYSQSTTDGGIAVQLDTIVKHDDNSTQ